MKKVICYVCIVCVLLFLLVGCKNTISRDEYVVATLESSSSSVLEWDSKVIIRDKKELDSFCQKFNLSKYNDEYDEDFFSDHVLVAGLFEWGYQNAQLSVNKVEINDSTMIITIQNKERIGNIHLTMMEYWVCIIEFSKTNTIDVNEVVFDFKTKRTVL